LVESSEQALKAFTYVRQHKLRKNKTDKIPKQHLTYLLLTLEPVSISLSETLLQLMVNLGTLVLLDDFVNVYRRYYSNSIHSGSMLLNSGASTYYLRYISASACIHIGAYEVVTESDFE
jgi:hypothetical protein